MDLDAKKQVWSFAIKFRLCFEGAGRIIIFLLFGWIMVVPTFVYLCFSLLFIRAMQVPTDVMEKFLNSEHHPAVKCMLMFLCPFLLAIKYVYIPLLQINLWIANFVYNCEIWVVTLGKSGWIGLIGGEDGEENIAKTKALSDFIYAKKSRKKEEKKAKKEARRREKMGSGSATDLHTTASEKQGRMNMLKQLYADGTLSEEDYNILMQDELNSQQ